MIEFFKHILIITGGVFCLALWAAVVLALFVELIDLVTGADKKTEIHLVDEDL